MTPPRSASEIIQHLFYSNVPKKLYHVLYMQQKQRGNYLQIVQQITGIDKLIMNCG
jgi:hypothetical protein